MGPRQKKSRLSRGHEGEKNLEKTFKAQKSELTKMHHKCMQGTVHRDTAFLRIPKYVLLGTRFEGATLEFERRALRAYTGRCTEDFMPFLVNVDLPAQIEEAEN